MSNSKYIDAVEVYEYGLRKLSFHVSLSEKSNFFLQAYQHITNRSLSKTDPIVDFGCGSGATTKWLYEEGYCVHGVDILEYWGKDAHLLGEIGPLLSDQVRSRLHTIDPIKNELPFPDASVQMIFSDQTLEHVFDYRPIFVEQARVLKPGGVAIHRFPHGMCCIEPHTKLPATPLTKCSAYLAIWAMLGLRNERQKGLGWRDTVTSNRKLVATTNYVSKREIFRDLSGLNLEYWFEDFLHISERRAGRFFRTAVPLGARRLAKILLSHVQDNRILVIRKPGLTG